MKGLAVIAEHKAKFGVTNAHRIPQHRMENRIELARRRTDDLENLRGGRKLFQRLVAFAGKPRDLRFLFDSGGMATAQGLCHIAALSRYRLPVSRFDWFTACSGAPSHCLPKGTQDLMHDAITAWICGLRNGLRPSICAAKNRQPHVSLVGRDRPMRLDDCTSAVTPSANLGFRAFPV